MNNGWIKLHRKLLESVVFQNEKALKIWVWCLLRVNHKSAVVLIGRQKITLNPGQFIMGSKRESEFLDIAKTTLWRWLEFLEREKMLELKKTTKYTVVTIPNWELYQEERNSNGTQNGTQVGTNKNDKNEKELVAEATEVLEVHETNEDYVPKREKKMTPEIQEVFDLFSDNPARLQWKLFENQRLAAKILHEEFGIETLANRYRIAVKYRGEELCPFISNPSQFLEKMPNMERFLKSQEV